SPIRYASDLVDAEGRSAAEVGDVGLDARVDDVGVNVRGGGAEVVLLVEREEVLVDGVDAGGAGGHGVLDRGRPHDAVFVDGRDGRVFGEGDGLGRAQPDR